MLIEHLNVNFVLVTPAHAKRGFCRDKGVKIDTIEKRTLIVNVLFVLGPFVLSSWNPIFCLLPASPYLRIQCAFLFFSSILFLRI